MAGTSPAMTVLLPYTRSLLQRGGKRWAVARDGQPLDARARAGGKRHIAWRDTGGAGDEGDQRGVRRTTTASPPAAAVHGRGPVIAADQNTFG
jgi:hypothetical protein